MTEHCKERTVKRLFSKIFTSKAESFQQVLEYEGRRGVILEVDTNNEWFVALADQKIDEFRKNVAATLIMFRKKSSSVVVTMKLVNNKEANELFIGDFESKIEEKGYGSILLGNTIKLAKKMGFEKITGNLSAVDYDHFDKLEHLYKKFGFEVAIDGKIGTIKISL